MLMMSSAWNGLEVIRSREKLLYQRTEYSIFPRPLFSQVVIWESAFVMPMKWWIQTRALFKLSSRNIQFWLLKKWWRTIQLYNFCSSWLFCDADSKCIFRKQCISLSDNHFGKCSKMSNPVVLISLDVQGYQSHRVWYAHSLQRILVITEICAPLD